MGSRASAWMCVVALLGCQAAAQEVGSCVCDLTSVVCDANCCCDPDCRSDGNAEIVHLAFTMCRKEQFGSKRAVECEEPPVSALEPFYINPYGNVKAVFNSEEEYYSREITTRSTNSEKSTVCIVYDNVGLDDASYESLSGGLTDPAALLEQINADENRGVWNFERSPVLDWVLPGAGGENQLPGTWYRVGDRVVAVQFTEGRIEPYLYLPQDVSGVCNDQVPALFLESVLPDEPRLCTRTGVLADVCSAASSRSNVLISKWRSIGIAPPLSRGRVAASYLTDAVRGTLVIVDDETGVQLGDATETVYDAGSSVCANAVVNVTLDIGYRFLETNAADRYVTESFVITVRVRNVATLPLTQQHSIIWRPFSQEGLPRARSGNPGYRRGTPIPAVDDAAQPSAPYDFALPFGYRCQDAVNKPVRFLHNVVSTGCTIELDFDQFRQRCVQEDVVQQSLPADLATPAGVGIYGNSDSAIPSQWVAVANDTTIPDGVGLLPDDVTRTCTVLVGYDYTFVLRRIGRVYNPQDVIEGVLRTGVYATWMFTTHEPGGLQKFALRWRASFVRSSQVNINDDAIEAPPLLPTVSDDIFYPFRRAREPTEDEEL
ncbi:hypothetical protein DIPPA_26845 [Diplonema papillatum]|nr:hypothetical protein DIPPA_26845 [Diplonema papillatum]|eukprot:gene22211-34085_t